MCDWRPDFEKMEARQDAMDRRLTSVEATLGEMRKSVEGGLADLKQQLIVLYNERSEWGKWLRMKIPTFLKWLGWFIAAVCGLYQIPQVIKQFT